MVKKLLIFSLLFGLLLIVNAQQTNIQKQIEDNFKKLYKVDLYVKFPSFPKYEDKGNENDYQLFIQKCNQWIATHPEYNNFLNSFKNSPDKANSTLRSE